MTGHANSSGESDCDVSVPGSTDGVDRLFDCMAVAERRRLVDRLADHTGQVDVDTLVQWLTEWDGNALAADAAETALVHVHLPKLDEAAVLQTDRETDTVERGRYFPVAVALLDVL